MNDHIKEMTQTFESLSIMDAPVSEEDRVVYLLASLPDSYNKVVTALETQSENVPKWSLVTERLLHQEAKLKEKEVEDGEVRKHSRQAASKDEGSRDRLSGAASATKLDISNETAENFWPLKVMGVNPLTQLNPNGPETTSL